MLGTHWALCSWVVQCGVKRDLEVGECCDIDRRNRSGYGAGRTGWSPQHRVEGLVSGGEGTTARDGKMLQNLQFQSPQRLDGNVGLEYKVQEWLELSGSCWSGQGLSASL